MNLHQIKIFNGEHSNCIEENINLWLTKNRTFKIISITHSMTIWQDFPWYTYLILYSMNV